MHFAINKHHLRFFYTHRYIEFEELLTQTDVQALREELAATQEKCYQASLSLPIYDTWRHSAIIRRVILSPQLAEIASNLVKVLPLRIAFDLFLSPSCPFEAFTKKSIPLYEMSCIQGVVCGCVLQLSSPPQERDILRDDGAFIPLSRQAGNGMFFASTLPISLDCLAHLADNQQLLIVYAKNDSLYTYTKGDPNTHSLKKLGYVFGDRLKNSTHPILFRR